MFLDVRNTERMTKSRCSHFGITHLDTVVRLFLSPLPVGSFLVVKCDSQGVPPTPR